MSKSAKIVLIASSGEMVGFARCATTFLEENGRGDQILRECIHGTSLQEICSDHREHNIVIGVTIEEKMLGQF